MSKSRGITERELDEQLLARIGMGNYLQRQTLSIFTDSDDKKEIPIPMEDYNSQIYKFEMRIGGVPYSDYRYKINEADKLVVLNDDEAGISKDTRVDFIFYWNAYINKTIESPTVYSADCEVKICSIEHNMNKYPHVQVLEVLYGAGIGEAGKYPAGAASKLLYPRIDYVDTNNFDLYLNEEYEAYLNPVINPVEEGKYIVTFDAPCLKSLLILVDKFELFTNEEYLYTDKKITEVSNPVKGFVKNQKIYGKTVQNFFNIYSIDAIYEEDFSRIIISEDRHIRKSGIYTLVNLSDKIINNHYANAPAVTAWKGIRLQPHEVKTFEIDIDNYDYCVCIGMIDDGWENTDASRAELKKSLLILEGDWTDKELPTKYFSGLSSLGEDKGYIEIKSMNKNGSEEVQKINTVLRSINGVCDELDVDKGIITRRIGTTSLFNNIGDGNIVPYTSYCVVYFDRGILELKHAISEVHFLANNAKAVNNEDFQKMYNVTSVSNGLDKIICVRSGIEDFAIAYSFETIGATPSNTSDEIISLMETYMSNNPITILYELVEPVIEKIYELPLKIADNTKEIIVDNNITPEMELFYPLNIKTSVNNLVDSINNLRDSIQKISNASNPNLLINSNFKNSVNQRGNAVYELTNATKYTIDRWNAWAGGTNNSLKVSITNHGLKFENTSTIQHTNRIRQALELKNFIPNSKVTASIKVSNVNGEFIFSILKGLNISDYAKAVTLARTKINKNGIYGITCGIGELDKDLLIVDISNNRIGDSVIIEYIKLEYGDKSTSFVPREYGEELAICQRYYEKTDNDIELSGFITAESKYEFEWQYKVEKRVSPTISWGNYGVADSNKDLFVYAPNITSHMRINSSVYSNNKKARWSIARLSNDVNPAGTAINVCGYFIADAEIY